MSNLDFSLFDKGLKELNIILTDDQKDQFVRYYELLVEWNSFMNLTAITDWDEVVVKHFLDSLSIVKIVNMTDMSYLLLDVGTGAGFPGIPLKIAFPNLKVVLLDSLNKRIKFLNSVIEELNLDNIEAYHGRAEEFGKNIKYREQFDFVVSRAVANLSLLSELCIPFIKVGGSFISYKSEKGYEELESSDRALKILGAELDSYIEFNLPDSELKRILFNFKKINNTPNKYPRKAGIPAKEPL